MSFEFVHQPKTEHKCDFPRYDTFTYGTIVRCRECKTYYTFVTGAYGPIWSEVTWLRHPFLYWKMNL